MNPIKIINPKPATGKLQLMIFSILSHVICVYSVFCDDSGIAMRYCNRLRWYAIPETPIIFTRSPSRIMTQMGVPLILSSLIRAL